MDLFKEIVPKNDQNPNFRAITTPGLNEPELQVIKNWADGFIDRDGKFVLEFQRTFNSSFWELYIFACFKELGFRVDFSYESPDFVVSTDKGNFVAETTIASNPEGYAPEWERDYNKTDDLKPDQILHIATIRLANAIFTKHQKYLSTYVSLEHVKGKPFVICLAPFEQPFFFMQNDHALRQVLYKYDRPLYYDDPSTGDRIIVGESWKRKISKDNDTEVELGFFTTEMMPEVSAIIFSNTATFTKVRALSNGTDYPCFA